MKPKTKSQYAVKDQVMRRKISEPVPKLKREERQRKMRNAGIELKILEQGGVQKKNLAGKLILMAQGGRKDSHRKRRERWHSRRRSEVMGLSQKHPRNLSQSLASQGQGVDLHAQSMLLPLNRWRCLCKCFASLLRNWKLHRKSFQFFLNNFDPLDQIIIESDSTKHKLLFDKSEFDSQKQGGLSSKTKAILCKNPKSRTEKEIRYARNALRNYKTIAEYPMSMQIEIARRAEMIEVDERRLLTRQGYQASNFHVILSGSAIVYTYDPSRSCHRLVSFINRGQSFGDTAIVSGLARETSVVSRESTQLLTIHRQDFLDIFLSGGLNNPNDPFLNTIPCLAEWPLEKLCNNPGKAMQCFFKQSYVLTLDTQTSDWLYVIKSGSCTVMKKLIREAKKKKKLKEILPSHMSALSHKQMLDQELSFFAQSLKTLPKTSIQSSKELLQEMNLPTSPMSSNQVQDCEVVSARDATTRLHTSKPFMSRLSKGARFPQLHIVGLADIFCGPQSSFCLVSNGAEVILINRKFFLEWLPSSTKQKLQNEVYPFASDKEMLSSVEGQMRWTSYKKTVSDRVLANLRRRHRQLTTNSKHPWNSIG
ncbi:hypothetical protein CAPTEDRAFT_202142 [Capitella teleta]|uniref:Cyclic nucleotide-binding domain-containing protein n=1 Tax=Capitella teleta TaxID=283909 RepID=R7UAA8_CAPTE|nr:hypothetical protein CAPTEDRAFT_202142 [Capitella teleta]|eukprot:ELU00748.1 hypothetical protein CAPTEDRAFT_202142 [Capitella teleta]